MQVSPRLLAAKPPFAAPGQCIGLLGGSFNPAHDAHRLISAIARRRLGLERVWWLVTPGNPLKAHADLAPLATRIAAARRVASAPWITVTGFEAALGSPFTVDTLAFLTRRYPGVRFVWIMGADSLATFHRWRGWTQIMREVPVAVVSRPWIALKSRFSPAARRFSRARLPSSAAKTLAYAKPPAWVYLRGPLNFASSTALRRQRAQTAPEPKSA